MLRRSSSQASILLRILTCVVGRGAMHLHAILSGIINAYLIMYLIFSDIFMKEIAEVIDSIVKAEIDISYHADHIMRQKPGAPLRPMSSAVDLPTNPAGPKYEHHVNCCACGSQIHLSKHLDSCVNCRVPYCRYCKGSVFAFQTGPKLISLIDDDPEHTAKTQRTKAGVKPKLPIKFTAIARPVPELPPPVQNIYGQPIIPVDTRPISFEIQRRRRPDNFDLVLLDQNGVERVNRELIKFLDKNLEVDDVLEQMIIKLNQAERDELKLALLEHDTWTTEYCPALVGIGTGNQALYTMGSGSSAKSVFVYCCTYITKNCAELSAVLSLLYDAKVLLFLLFHLYGHKLRFAFMLMLAHC